jgi:hypothetical protein
MFFLVCMCCWEEPGPTETSSVHSRFRETGQKPVTVPAYLINNKLTQSEQFCGQIYTRSYPLPSLFLTYMLDRVHVSMITV